MAFDLIPRRVFSVPSMQNFWDDFDDIVNVSGGQSGLSISEDKDKVYVEASVPGVDPKDVEITYKDGYLWISAESKKEEKEGRKYYRQSTSSFSYRIAVPGDIDSSKEPEATYKHGVMKIEFMKSPKEEPKKITVKNVE